MESASLLRFATDQRLAEHVAAGSDRAFEALYDRWQRPILAFCRHMLGSREEAEDAFQHTFMAAYRDLMRSGPPAAVRPWLFVIARNHCISILRARRELPAAEVPERATHQLAVEIDVREELRAVFAGLARLPEDQRAALVLTELGDVSHDDIARILDCRREQVKSYVFQARCALAADRAARDTPCAEIRAQLVELRGGSLRRNAIRRHLSDCPGCRAYRETLRTQRRQLRALFPIAPALALKRAVLGAVLGGGGGGSAAGLGGLAATAVVAIAIPASGAAVAKDDRPRERRAAVVAPARDGSATERTRAPKSRATKLVPARAPAGEARGTPDDRGRETAPERGEYGGGRETAGRRDETPRAEDRTEAGQAKDGGTAPEESDDTRRGLGTAPGQTEGRGAGRGRGTASGREKQRRASNGRGGVMRAGDREAGRGRAESRGADSGRGGVMRAGDREAGRGRAESRGAGSGRAAGGGPDNSRSERRGAGVRRSQNRGAGSRDGAESRGRTEERAAANGGARDRDAVEPESAARNGSQPQQDEGATPPGGGEAPRPAAHGEPGAPDAAPVDRGKDPGNGSADAPRGHGKAGDAAHGGGAAATIRRQD